MKNMMNHLMVAAAAITAVAGAASAQSMKAEIPFSFGVAGKVMPAGTYFVTTTSHLSSTPVFRLLNSDAKKAVLTQPIGVRETKASTDVKLVFLCNEGNCALAQIWTGSVNGAYNLHTPKTSRTEASLITIAATRAD